MYMHVRIGTATIMHQPDATAWHSYGSKCNKEEALTSFPNTLTACRRFWENMEIKSYATADMTRILFQNQQ